VTVSQDTTELDFTHMKELEGLGPLNSETRRGFYLHTLYAGSEDGLPLGLLDLAMLVRDDETFRGTDTRKQRPIEEKESRRWLDGYLKTQELARRLPACEVFSISDREGDIFDVYGAWQRAAAGPGPWAHWIIRANQDRALLGMENGEPAKLFAALAAAPGLGEIQFEMNSRRGMKKVKGSNVTTFRSARTVRQVVRAMEITPRPPWRKDMQLEQVSFWAILAEETNPPAGEEPSPLVAAHQQESDLPGGCPPDHEPLFAALGHRGVPPGVENRVPRGAHPAQDHRGGDERHHALCGDRMAHSVSDPPRAAPPGPAVRVRV
jgi:hypothetical protein